MRVDQHHALPDEKIARLVEHQGRLLLLCFTARSASASAECTRRFRILIDIGGAWWNCLEPPRLTNDVV